MPEDIDDIRPGPQMRRPAEEFDGLARRTYYLCGRSSRRLAIALSYAEAFSWRNDDLAQGRLTLN